MTDQSRRDAMKLTAAAGAAALGGAFLTGGAAFAQVADRREVTFEQINEAVERTGLRGPEDVRAFAAQINAQQARAAIGDTMCPAYRAVREILLGFARSPLCPPRWRVAIEAFCAAMDLICGIE